MATSPSGGGGGGGEPKLQWMYAGPQSIVDREKYLLGSKIDRNFELYAAKEDKRDASQLDSLLSQAASGSGGGGGGAPAKYAGLDLDTIRKEDPLVAIRVKEERVRQELLDNPLRMKRLQKIVTERMRRKMNEMLQRRRQVDGSQSDESSDGDERRRTKSTDKGRAGRDRSHKDKDTARHHHKREREHSRKKSRSRSPNKKSATSAEKRRKVDEGKSGPVDYDAPDSDEERRKKRFAGYGLVKANKSGAGGSAHSAGKDGRAQSKQQVAQATGASPAGAKAKRERLSAEEMERRRADMVHNAEWRRRQRDANLHMYEHKDRLEKESEDRVRSAAGHSSSDDFVRPLLARAVGAAESVASQVQRNRARHQRRHGDMETNFAKK